MKFNRALLILSIFLSFQQINLSAQEKVKEIILTNVKGIAIGSNNESIDQITARAVNEAKIEALKKAGIEENITSFTNFFQSESSNNYEELFTSDILSDIHGAVKSVKILNTNKTFNEYENLQVEVIINCTVVKYLSEKDLSFNVWVDGVGMFYANESKLLFKIKSSKNAYVNAFIFNEKEAYQLFPNELENSFLFVLSSNHVMSMRS